MRYLVTGGLGVIGSQIARRLLEQGHRVWIIDSADEPRNKWIRAQLEAIGGDCYIEESRIEKFPIAGWLDVQGVIHCAASTGIPYSVTKPADDWERNVEGTRVLLEALRKHPVPTVVLSSVKPYAVPSPDILKQRGGLTEEDVLAPDEPYAASKAAQSMLCQAYARSYDLPIVTFRCSNLYGPAPCHGPRHGWATWMCISAAIGRSLVIQGSGRQSRDLLFATDVYDACMAGLRSAPSLRGRVFNIGGGSENRIQVLSLAESLQARTGVEIKFGPPRAMDDEHVYVNNESFNTATGWAPSVSVTKGIEETISWAIQNAVELAELYKGL